MSTRTAITLAMVIVVVIATAVTAIIGVVNIHNSVMHEVRSRIDQNIKILQFRYLTEINGLSARLDNRVKYLQEIHKNPATSLAEIKRALKFTVTNMCDANGVPIAGSYADKSVRVPINSDPVLRNALRGETTSGTVLLDSDRLYLEGGAALANSIIVPSKGNNSRQPMTKALFWWFASPIHNAEGRVIALVYGGRTLNHNYELVDSMRDMIFCEDRNNCKPIGAVTIFIGKTRIATNVFSTDGTRAIGTTVPNEVERQVINQQRLLNYKTFIADEWYLSAYEPLKDPAGHIVGMLGAGMLEAPYKELREQTILEFASTVVIGGLLAAIVALLIVIRITYPLRKLSNAANRITSGDWHTAISISPAYTEIAKLGQAFSLMQSAIANRDRELTDKNTRLTETNEKLQRVNNNYMQTLSFITHELNSPLAAIQMRINGISDETKEELPQHIKYPLERIKRNCEDLQDMVRNYLDLTRAERDELVARIASINFFRDVVEPCVEQTGALFSSRHISLETECAHDVIAEADAELMRIALCNLLSNAAKYGLENGLAKLTVRVEGHEVRVSVWNEGRGFSVEEAQELFHKFSRLRNEATRDHRGSGLGLYICKKILDLHNGKVYAESEQGNWARFSFSFPIQTPSEV